MEAIVLIPCQAVVRLPLLFCILVLVLHQQSAVQLQVHWLVDICKHSCKTAAGIRKASSEGGMRLATVLCLGSIFSPEPRQYCSTSGWCRNILYVPLMLVIICDWSSLNGIPNPLIHRFLSQASSLSHVSVKSSKHVSFISHLNLSHTSSSSNLFWMDCILERSRKLLAVTETYTLKSTVY